MHTPPRFTLMENQSVQDRDKHLQLRRKHDKAYQRKLPTKENHSYGKSASTPELASLSIDDSLPSASLGVALLICPWQHCEDWKSGSHTEDTGDDTTQSRSPQSVWCLQESLSALVSFSSAFAIDSCTPYHLYLSTGTTHHVHQLTFAILSTIYAPP